MKATGEYGSTRMKRKVDSNASNTKPKHADEESSRPESSESVRMIQSDVSSASSSAISSLEGAVNSNTLLFIEVNRNSAPTATVSVVDTSADCGAEEDIFTDCGAEEEDRPQIPPFESSDPPKVLNGFLIPDCIKHIKKSIAEGFFLDKPVLVGKTTTKSCVKETLSHLESDHVRVVIQCLEDHFEIFITDLAAGGPHGAGVAELLLQSASLRTVYSGVGDFLGSTGGTQDWVDTTTLPPTATTRAPDAVIKQITPTGGRLRRGILYCL
jgi:hypothetical protein